MKISIVLLFSLLGSSYSFAQPEVSGNVISWPDNGWYQVQRSEDFTTVCEGGRSCDVQPGSYIVINHSDGERFEVVVTQSSGNSSDNSNSDQIIRVEGNTISWPDNGWYEVQRADDSSSVCQGERECQVAPGGTYNVINHTTGQRFENIVLADAVRPPRGELPELQISGNSIGWTAPGWHQVQDSSTFATVCEGGPGTDCFVEPGTYIVVNHNTGVRFENIVVSSNTVTEEDRTTIPAALVTVEGQFVSWQGSGYFQLQSLPDFQPICEGEINNCTVANGIYQLVNHTSGQVWRDIVVSDSSAPLAETSGAPDNRLTDAQRSRLPADCLLDVDREGSAYCFSPLERQYLAVSAAGQIRYDYVLPGNNDSNRVRALSLAADETQVCLVADVTHTLGDSRYEISCFTTGGAFIGTAPTLTELPRYADAIKLQQPFGINLDGEPLRVINFNFDYLLIQGTRYTHDATQNANDRSNWSRAGDFVAQVRYDTGELAAWQDFDASVTAIVETPGARSYFEVGGQKLELINDVLPFTTSGDPASLSPQSIALRTPAAIFHLQGNSLQQFADNIIESLDVLQPQIIDLETSGCIVGQAFSCEQQKEAAPVEINCEAGGTATFTQYAATEIPFATLQSRTVGERWEFRSCQLPQLDNDGQPVFKVLDGRFDNERSITRTLVTRVVGEGLNLGQTIVPVDADQKLQRFNELTVSIRLPSRTTVAFDSVEQGELRNTETRDGISGQQRSSRLGTFSNMNWSGGSNVTATPAVIISDARVGQEIARPLDTRIGDFRDRAGFQVQDPEPDALTGQGLEITLLDSVSRAEIAKYAVNQRFVTSFVTEDSSTGMVSSSGQLTITSTNGDSATLQLTNSPTSAVSPAEDIYGDELVEYTINHQGTQIELTKPSASLFIPWH